LYGEETCCSFACMQNIPASQQLKLETFHREHSTTVASSLARSRKSGLVGRRQELRVCGKRRTDQVQQPTWSASDIQSRSQVLLPDKTSTRTSLLQCSCTVAYFFTQKRPYKSHEPKYTPSLQSQFRRNKGKIRLETTDSHGQHSSTSGPQATNATRVLEQDQTFDTTGVLYNTTESFAPFRQNRLKIKTLATEMGYVFSCFKFEKLEEEQGGPRYELQSEE
jgi:hypothetical protein